MPVRMRKDEKSRLGRMRAILKSNRKRRGGVTPDQRDFFLRDYEQCVNSPNYHVSNKAHQMRQQLGG